MFEFWDWVGGRYSMWSAIGLSLMVAIGPDNFRDLLAGAHAMDEHFRTAPFDENLPVLMGVLGCWYRDFLDAQTQAVVPYAQALVKLPSYLQQLEMESNGKSVAADGSPVDAPTGEIVWGTVGTNGQHAYFQLLAPGHGARCRSTSSASIVRSPVTSSATSRICSSRTCSRRRRRSRSAPTIRRCRPTG